MHNIIAAVAFAVIYAARLAYQAVLLRKRDRVGTHGDWGEILLVIVPKNILVILAILLLYKGVPWNALFVAGWIIFLGGIAVRFIALGQLGDMYSLNVDLRKRHRLVTN